MTEVSVIVPNYNHSKYLRQRLNSIVNQTFHNFEIIILDDCSTDNSKNIIEEYRHNNKVSSIVYNNENSGSTFKQWDKGIQLAKGEFIWIAESDDWCEKDFLETIVTGLKKNERTAFGYSQGFCVNDNDEVIFQSNHPKLEEYIPKEKFLEDYLTYYNSVYNASMVVFRKHFYKSVNKYYKSLKFAGDQVFWAELSRQGDVYVNARLLNYFRKHDKDVTSKVYASGYNFIEEVNMLDYFGKKLDVDNNLIFKSKIRIYNRFKLHNHINFQMKKEIKNLFFKNVSFLQKNYFIIIQKLYNLKLNLSERLSTT